MNNKLIINTNLLRKESEFKTYTCVVEKAVPVPTEEFERLKHTPMCNNDLISENLNSMWYGNGVHHCLLIYDKQQGDGLLIESEGAPYARYAQYIPNAKLLYENHMQNHLQELKFYCPLEINREPECRYDEEYEKISSYEASAYKSEINRFIEDFTMPEEKERGLMNWYGKGNSVDQRYARHLCLSRSATESLLALLRLRFTVSLQMKSLKNSARTARDNFQTALGSLLNSGR